MLVDLEVLAVLLGELATLGSLFDRKADPAAGEVEISAIARDAVRRLRADVLFAVANDA